MSSPVVIRAENVTKKYVISHIAKQQTIRDAMHHGLRLLWRRLRWQTKLNREEFLALKDVSFDVKQGEVIGIIGRNGAGKSTLLKILSRITEPTKGRISINGRVASLLEVGTGFHPELTGRENIFLNGAILGMTQAEVRSKFDEIAAFAEIDQFIDTPVKRYSSGMYVRLAFAVAAHLEPEILIVDEVLAVGDAAFQKKCLGKMQDVARESGRTVLFVSHNLEALAAICQTALLLSAGQVVMRGDPQAVIARYFGDKESSVAHFPVDSERPSITQVELDHAALARGELLVQIAFVSPYPLDPPVAGLVLSTRDSRPVFGTNMRMHPTVVGSAAASGTCILHVPRLPLHSGAYGISLWLGDAHRDYDSKPDVLLFNFQALHSYPKMPPVRAIGPLDIDCRWSRNTS